MRFRTRIASAAAVASLSAAALFGGALASPAGATTPGHDRRPTPHAVFVETDNVTRNQVVAYSRAADGALSPAGTYDTWGKGGTLTGAVVDRTASQGALAYDDAHSLLFAVNAGSNTVSVFSVSGTRLRLVQVVRSGGNFPVSVAVHGNLAYVLNARDGGSVQGYRLFADRLFPIPGSTRSLGLDPSLTPEFTHTPGQVAFSPNGSKLLVTTKAATSAVDVFQVRFDGWLSAAPVVTTFPGSVPFAVTFDRDGHAVVANAGSNSVTTLRLNADGTLTTLDSDPTNQAATCWIVRVGDRFYASNAGSASLTGFQGSAGGQLGLIGNTTTDAGTVDAAATPAGDFLYVQAGAAGIVDGFHVNADGTLSAVGSVTVPDAVGGEGIVAT